MQRKGGRSKLGKKETYERQLAPLIERYFEKGDEARLLAYLTGGSSLPGPRANLELLGAFGDLFTKRCRERPASYWKLAMKLAGMSRSVEGRDEPSEFGVLCGVVALASVGAALPQYLARAATQMKGYSHSERWRTREAAAIGLQRMIQSDAEKTLGELESWVEGEDDWLAMRAVAAGVAEPALVKDHTVAERALDLHRKILSRIASAGKREGEEFRALRQTLGYSLSVVVKEIPKEGFGYLRQIARGRSDPDLGWIVKEILKKDRLVKNFPDEVKAVGKLVS